MACYRAERSEIVVGAYSDAERKAQEDWLRNELKGTRKPCTLAAYWHNPRFSSGWHGGDLRLTPIWQILYDGGADLVLNGHDHDYERYRPQDPQGVLDTAKGIPEYVVGTGGGDLRGFEKVTRNSAVRIRGLLGSVEADAWKGRVSLRVHRCHRQGLGSEWRQVSYGADAGAGQVRGGTAC